jgi:hypothetical protein
MPILKAKIPNSIEIGILMETLINRLMFYFQLSGSF